MKNLMRRMIAQLDAALLILVVGFAFSLAANLLWTWSGGIVRILGGALASFALPGAIHLWDKVPLPLPKQLRVWRLTLRFNLMRLVRALAMALIAGMAAYTTFTHASHLLIDRGEDPLLAMLYPVMTELLVVMGVLARKVPAEKAAPKTRARRDASSTPAAPATTVQLSKTPDPGKPAELGAKRLERDRSRRDVGREWARRNWPVTGTAIANELGVSRAEGDRIRQSIKNEVESAS